MNEGLLIAQKEQPGSMDSDLCLLIAQSEQPAAMDFE